MRYDEFYPEPASERELLVVGEMATIPAAGPN